MIGKDLPQGDGSCGHVAPNPSPGKFAGRIDWEKTFEQGEWDYLSTIGETPRYAAVAGYIHKLLPRGRILDVGCGEGLLLDYLDLGRIEYSGFDISPTAVARANQRHVDKKIFVGSLDDFEPFDNELSDVIVFNESLQFARQPIETLNRFHSFLTSSGRIIISQFQSRNPQSHGAQFTRMFNSEIQAGRVRLIASSEVMNCDTGLKWTIYCLGCPPNGRDPGGLT